MQQRCRLLLPLDQGVRTLKLCHPSYPFTHLSRMQAAPCGTDKLVNCCKTRKMGSFRVTIPLRGT